MTTRAAWLAPALAALCALLPCVPLLVSPLPFAGSGTDQVTFEFPFAAFVSERLHHGDLPLWNPYHLGGVPFEAGVHGHLSPSYWTLWLLPVQLDLKVGIALHLMAAAAGAAFWGTRRFRSAPAAVLTGVAFALSAFFLLHVFAGHRRMIFTAAHLPWIGAFIERAIRERRGHVAAVIAVGLAFWCGHLHVMYLGLLGLASYFIVDALLRDRGGPALLRAAGSLVFAIACGALLAAFRILPLLDTSRLSSRASGSAEFAASYASAPMNVLTYLWPHLFGNRVDAPFVGTWAYWEGLGYIGLAPLVLALLAPLLLPARVWVAGALTSALGLVLSFGAATPLFDVYLRALPGAELFRSPGRFVLWPALFGALLAGEFLDRALRGELMARRVAWARIATWLLPALALLFLAWLWSARPEGLGRFVAPAAPPDHVQRALAFARTDALRVATFLIGIAGTLHFVLRARARPATGWILVGLTLLDLWTFGGRFLRTAPEAVFTWPPEITDLLRARAEPGLRIMEDPDLDAPMRCAPLGISHVGGYDTFVPADYIRYVLAARGRETTKLVSYYKTSVTTRMIDRLGARYLVWAGELTSEEARRRGFAGWAEVARARGIRVYENPRPAPRAFVTHRAEVMAEADVHARLADPAFDLRDALLVEEPIPAEFTLPGDRVEGDVARITRFEPDRVDIEVAATEPGALVLSDSWHRGWRAEVDGKPAPLIRADAVMRAVPIPSGAHRVVMRFRPSTLPLGAAVSLATLLGLAIFAGVRANARRGEAARRVERAKAIVVR